MKVWTILLMFHCLAVCCCVVCARPMKDRLLKSRSTKKTRGSRNSKKLSSSNHKSRTRLIDYEPDVVESMRKPKKLFPSPMTITAGDFQDDYDSQLEENSWEINGLNEIITQVECPAAEDGMKMFACPTPTIGKRGQGHFKCIDDHALCDGIAHCPNGEDENRTVCMFHKMTMNYFRVMMNALIGITRSVV